MPWRGLNRRATANKKGAGAPVPSRCRFIRPWYPEPTLASVNHAFNAVAVRGDVVGDTLFYGRGAGADATASSVLSDLADAALDLKNGSHRRVPPFVAHEGNGRWFPSRKWSRDTTSASA